MLFEKTTLLTLPKNFSLWDALDYINPTGEDPESIIYDGYLGELSSGGIDSMDAFHYGESATGVSFVWYAASQTLQINLSKWAVPADVDFFALYVNALLKHHPRAKLIAEDKVLKEISAETIESIKNARFKYLRKKLAAKTPFDMVGLNTICEVNIFDDDIDSFATALQQDFAAMQWERPEVEQ